MTPMTIEWLSFALLMLRNLRTTEPVVLESREDAYFSYLYRERTHLFVRWSEPWCGVQRVSHYVLPHLVELTDAMRNAAMQRTQQQAALHYHTAASRPVVQDTLTFLQPETVPLDETVRTMLFKSYRDLDTGEVALYFRSDRKSDAEEHFHRFVIPAGVEMHEDIVFYLSSKARRLDGIRSRFNILQLERGRDQRIVSELQATRVPLHRAACNGYITEPNDGTREVYFFNQAPLIGPHTLSRFTVPEDAVIEVHNHP